MHWQECKIKWNFILCQRSGAQLSKNCFLGRPWETRIRGRKTLPKDYERITFCLVTRIFRFEAPRIPGILTCLMSGQLLNVVVIPLESMCRCCVRPAPKKAYMSLAKTLFGIFFLSISISVIVGINIGFRIIWNRFFFR